MQSSRYLFDYLLVGQAQKELTINEAFYTLELFSNNCIVSSELSTPPEIPKEGEIYIIPSKAEGEWKNYEHKLAYFQGSWKFLSPSEGMIFFVKDKKQWVIYQENTWEMV